VRHHLLSVNGEVDDEVLQRLDLDDDEVAPASHAEGRRGWAGAKRSARGEPRQGIL
jgi:hypothetical protein